MPRKPTGGNRIGIASGAFLLLLHLSPSAADLPSSETKSTPAATPFDAAASPHPDSLARLVADRYGARDFHKVRSLHFVFNVKTGGKESVRRWTWFPKSDSVVYGGKDPGGLEIQAGYSRRNRFSMESQGIQPIDKWFVNDQYWLFFPLHLVWDKGLRLEAGPAAPAMSPGAGRKSGPRKAKGGEEAWRLTATYPSEGGYTPGDAYDLFVDSSGIVQRWIFRKGNDPKPTREAFWSKPVPVGPLNLSLERPGTEKDFKIRFTDVKAETDP